MRRDFAILLAHRGGMDTRELSSLLNLSPRRIEQIIKNENHTLRRCPVYKDQLGLGWNMFPCTECRREYDRQDCEIHACDVHSSPLVFSYTCPFKHHGESEQIWRTRIELDDTDFLRALGIRK